MIDFSPGRKSGGIFIDTKQKGYRVPGSAQKDIDYNSYDVVDDEKQDAPAGGNSSDAWDNKLNGKYFNQDVVIRDFEIKLKNATGEAAVQELKKYITALGFDAESYNYLVVNE